MPNPIRTSVITVATPRGPARVHVDPGPRGLLVLGHGAGGGPEAPDLLAARDGALAAGWSVARIEQPWRVAGKRVAAPATQLDEAFLAIVTTLTTTRATQLPLTGPLVVGGRSSGARVACRTATELGAAAVLALAFPLVPPGKATSRAPELALPDVPRLVIQGSRDAFGIPAASTGTVVEVVDGADHGFAVRRKDGRTAADVVAQVRDLVRDWLQTVT